MGQCCTNDCGVADAFRQDVGREVTLPGEQPMILYSPTQVADASGLA